MTAEDYISSLKMRPHPEGGYFIETCRSLIPFQDEQSVSSSILFLLHEKEVDVLHRLQEDEYWIFQDGGPLQLVMIDLDDNLQIVTLGKDVNHGEKLIYRVPKGYIFGSIGGKGFSLVTCLVTPEYLDEHFELFNRDDLIKRYPQFKKIITDMTRI